MRIFMPTKQLKFGDFDMLEKTCERTDLIEMLRWQFDMGIDEALLDFPNSSALPVRLDELLAPTNLNEIISTNTTFSPITGAMPQDATKPVIAQDLPATGRRGTAAPNSLSNILSLAALKAGLAGLDDCSLSHTASNLCFADGNPGSRVMIIGEVPGRDEDRMGVPFVGVAGQLLDKMLASISLDRSSVYLTNLLPWRPPGNRAPTDEELAVLSPWLFRHVQLANPNLVLLLGGAAAKLVFSSHNGIMKLRGQWCDMDFGDGVFRPTLASLHPAYLLRSPAQKRLAFDDFLMLARRLNLVTADDKSG